MTLRRRRGRRRPGRHVAGGRTAPRRECARSCSNGGRERPPYSKALTIYPRTVEQFAMRGLVDRWLAEGTPVPSSHFALLKNRLDFSFLPHPLPVHAVPAAAAHRGTARAAPGRARRAVPARARRHRPAPGRATASTSTWTRPTGPTAVRAAYAVGCDGASSVVRAAAGIDFAGTPDTWRTILGDVELTDPPQAPGAHPEQPGRLDVHDRDRRRPVPGGHHRPRDAVRPGRRAGDVRASCGRARGGWPGTDFGMRETPDMWLSRVGNAARQADRYRAGRVLLAGDAAHIHYPAGGQGLNLGPAGRHQPGLEAGRRDPRLGAARPARQLPRRALPGRPGRDRRLAGPVRPDRQPQPRGHRPARPLRHHPRRPPVRWPGNWPCACPAWPSATRPATASRPRRPAGPRPRPARRPRRHRLRPAPPRASSSCSAWDPAAGRPRPATRTAWTS